MRLPDAPGRPLPMLTSAGRRHARRFVKYCIVGASSTLIQMTTLQVILRLLDRRDPLVVVWGNDVGAVLAILNGFYWNRRWTFRQHGRPGVGGQFLRFLAVNAVGLALNTGLMTLFYGHLRLFDGHAHAPLLNQILTIAIVVFWNYTANAKWSFSEPGPPPPV